MFLTFIFVALMAVSLGAALLWARPKRAEETLAARLHDLYRPEHVEAGSRVNVSEDAEGTATRLQRMLRHSAFNRLHTLLAQSQSTLTLSAFLVRSLVPGAVLGTLALLLHVVPAVVVVALFLVGAALPWQWLRMRRDRRLRRIEEALPDTAAMMGRALRAGHSVQQALELVAADSTGPLADEFRQLHQEQKFGVPLREALRSLADRVPSHDLHFLVTGILVQKDTGGDLIEILDRITHVIRERLRVQREIRTYTAQGRLTGWILSALPVVLLLLTAIITPSYSDVMFHDRTGQQMLAAAAALIVMGSLIIRKVVKVEV